MNATILRKAIPPGARIRVLVVDDSVVIRRLVAHALAEDPTLEVVGAASNGAIALERIAQWNPDVITLDIEMPEMDGLTVLRRIRNQAGRPRVVMFSTLTDRGAALTLESLALGADDYVTKAANVGSLDRSMASLRKELIPKIKQFFLLTGTAPAVASPTTVRRPVAEAARHGLRPASPGVPAEGIGDRRFHRRPHRAGGHRASVSGGLSAAHPDRAAHAALVHAVPGRASPERHQT